MSSWYVAQDEKTRAAIRQIADRVADATVFGFLCVLDGVRVVENRESKGSFELWYVNGSDRVLLNREDAEFLHDLWRAG